MASIRKATSSSTLMRTEAPKTTRRSGIMQSFISGSISSPPRPQVSKKKFSPRSLEIEMQKKNSFYYSIKFKQICESKGEEQAIKFFNDGLKEKKFGLERVPFNAAIAELGKRGKIDMARKIFVAMKFHQVEPDLTTYIAILNAHAEHSIPAEAEDAAKSRKVLVNSAMQLYREMLNSGIVGSTESFNCLLKVLAHHGDFDHLEEVFPLKSNAEDCFYLQEIQPNVVTYTTAIQVCSKHKEVSIALQYLDEMLSKNIQPDALVLNAILSGYRDYAMSICSYSNKIDRKILAAKSAEAAEFSISLFNQFTKPNETFAPLKPTAISIGIVLETLRNVNQIDKAIEFYDSCLLQFPNSLNLQNMEASLINLILTILGRSANTDRLYQFLNQVATSGIGLNVYMINSLLDIFSSKNNLDNFSKLLELYFGFQVAQKGSLPFQFVRPSRKYSPTVSTVFQVLNSSFSAQLKKDFKIWLESTHRNILESAIKSKKTSRFFE